MSAEFSCLENAKAAQAPFADAQVYREAARLIANKDHWCQYAGATNERGIAEDPLSGRACRWCVQGAVTRATFNLYFQPIDRADRTVVDCLERQLYDYRGELQDRLDTLARQYHNMFAHQVNDNAGHYPTGHPDVIRLLRVASRDLSHDEAWKELRRR